MRLGTTLFSFTNEWLARRYTFAGLLRRTAELELGPGIEVVGYQAWREYPALGKHDVLEFRRLCDELGLEPAALGGYVDLARRRDRLVTTDEALAVLRAQIDTAERLGIPVLRLHLGVPGPALEAAVGYAERKGVTLATEVQGGQAPDHPDVATVLECRDRLGSPALAIALDFTVAMSGIPSVFVAALARAGMAESAVDALVALWTDGASTPELLAALAELDAPAAALAEARSGLVRFGRQEPERWLPLVPSIAYAHAKFWELDDEGDDRSVRTPELFRMLADGGYDGIVASEWGGSAWQDADEVDAFALVRRHHARCRGLLAGATAPAGSNTNVLSLVSEGDG